MEIRKADVLKQGTEIVGNRTKVKVAKNKVAPPFRTAEFDIIYGKGISKEGDILDLAADVDIVNKSGAWYAYKDEKIGQGRENAKAYLKEHPEILEEIEAQVRAHYGLDNSADEDEAIDTAVEEKPKKSRKSKAAEKEDDQIELSAADMEEMGELDDMFEDTEVPEDDVLIIPSDAYRRIDD